MSSFTKPLDLRFHDRPLKEKPFELLEEFEFYYHKILITIPAGYCTDFASIPRFFHRVLNPVGPHGKAAVVHDWLCDGGDKRFNYIDAANVFDEGMRVLNVKPWKRKTMVRAVKTFGPKF